MALSRLTKVDSGGISTTSDYRVGVITATKFVGPVEGSITATDASFSGNVTIGGTLTYEDVTNIDSVGIITAQSDVHVGAGLSVVGVTTTTDLTVEKSGNLNANIKSTAGWGALEVGGATAGYIDIKKPFSDDFDLRLMVDGTGTNYISSNAANLKLYAQGNNGIELGPYGAASLKYSNDTKLVTTGVGVSIPKDLDVDGHTNLDNVSIAGVTTFAGDIETSKNIVLGDGSDGNASINRLKLGASGDLQIYHNQYHSKIVDGGTGALIISGSEVRFETEPSSTETLRIDSGGGVLVGTSTVTASKVTVYGANDAAAIFQGSGTGTGAANGFLVGNNGGTDGLLWNYENGATRFATNNVERFLIDTAGNVGMGTNVVSDSTGNARAFTIARSDANGQVRLILKNQATGFGNGAGYHQGIDGANVFIENRTNGGYIDFATFDSGGSYGSRLRITSNGVGIRTTTQAGRNAGVSTATGTIIYNAETEKVQVYANATWRNVGSLEPDQSSGFYDSLSAAQAAGLSHYWPGNSSTSLISGLQPDDRKGNPTFNNKEHDGYGATNPFFHFAGQTGSDNPTGYRYTHTADWVGHSFSICYWVKIMQEVTEGESTYVQLGSHSGLRSMFAMSSSGNTNLRGKTITIGDDNANDQIQYEFANWIHVGVRYNYGANSATYYKNGVQTENHTFNQSLSVGTGSNHIYLGYGYWNGSSSNKESCSRMSDIGIWDSTSINGANFMEIYKAGRIVKGY